MARDWTDEQWMGQLAAQDTPDYDVFERAAQRVKQAVRPEGGRDEYPGQILAPVVHALGEPIRKGQGLLQSMRDYTAQEFPATQGATQQTTDYDARKTAADSAAGTAFNLVTSPMHVPAGAGEMVLGAGARDLLWSPLSLQKLAEPLDMTAHRFKDVRVPVPKIVNPEKLVGGYGVFPPWDLSATNRTATHINDTKLQRPVVAQGGMGFPEANPGLGLASTQGAAQAFETQMAKLAETGKPVYIMPQTMTPQAIDASRHVADPLAQLTAQAPITIKDAKAFDKMMREEVPDWKGIKSKDFDSYFTNLDMGSKSHAAKRMALEQWQSKGFPNVAGIRHAMSDLGLVDLPGNTIGATISRYTPGKGLLDTTHADYPKGIAAEHMGQLATLAPYDVGAPTIARALAQRNEENFARGAKSVLTATRHANYPTKGLPTSQYFDNEWLDNYMKYVN